MSAEATQGEDMDKRDLSGKSYDRMTHNEILDSHSQRYAQMTTSEKQAQVRERNAAILARLETKSGGVKWRKTAQAGLLAVAALIANRLYTGTQPGIVAVFACGLLVLGTMFVEATHAVCARLENISESVERVDERLSESNLNNQ
jgi:hypothetical protein